MTKLKNNKKWYKSKTVQAAIFSCVVVILSAILGETDPIVTTAVSIGSALGIYGRFKATSTI